MAGASAPAIFFCVPLREMQKNPLASGTIGATIRPNKGLRMQIRTRSSKTAKWRFRSRALGAPIRRLYLPLGLLSALLFDMSTPPLLAQKPSGPSSPPVPASAPVPTPKASADPFDQNSLLYGNKGSTVSPVNGDPNVCFLPPLDAVRSPSVPVANLQTATKAKKEYAAACEALKGKKIDAAEEHLRKAVEREPNYPAAWVTLGQILAARQQTEGARNACARALAADPTYLPPYLCLTDIAARAQEWDETLKLSVRALQLEPTNDFVAYGYNAAANMNLHRLPDAEKSALKALEIDKNNRDPRVHFLLAQIYEAEGDPAKEAAQLHEYLKFATDPGDIALVKQVLSQLEK
jgi:cytochrome c-type biogenesis protein CcmH/NrfG